MTIDIYFAPKILCMRRRGGVATKYILKTMTTMAPTNNHPEYLQKAAKINERMHFGIGRKPNTITARPMYCWLDF